MADAKPRFAFAGDRDVAVEVLSYLLEIGDRPLALLLSNEGRASHDEALLRLCETAAVAPPVIRGGQLTDPRTAAYLGSLDLDFIVCVHFPYIVRRPVLEAAKHGVLNLHPSLLPYNRGWHTPTWALLDGTPAGATLHYMDEGLDTGDVIHQLEAAIDPADTAHTLYAKLKALEVVVFKEGWQRLRNGQRQGRRQDATRATMHRREALFDPTVQRIDLDAPTTAGTLLRRLRGLTTSSLDEAAYFEQDGRTYRVQVRILADDGRGVEDGRHLRDVLHAGGRQ